MAKLHPKIILNLPFLEEQVTSFEISKKLKDFGVKQKSLFCWFYEPYSNYWVDYDENKWESYPAPEKICSAFTSEEINQLLNQLMLYPNKSIINPNLWANLLVDDIELNRIKS